MPLPRPTRQPYKPKDTTANPPDPINFRPSDVFRFDPKPDITPDELARLVAIFWTLDLNFDRFSNLEDELRQHFTPIKIEKNK
jgi:hypothetical protein